MSGIGLASGEMIHCSEPVIHEHPLLVGCRCCGHRNLRHVADGQVAGSNVGNGASISGGRLTPVSLLESLGGTRLTNCKVAEPGRY